MPLVRTDKEGLLRDTSSRAVLNSDVGALNAYKQQRKKAQEFEEIKSRVEQFAEHNRRIDTIEDEINEIKSTLDHILEKINDSSSS